MKFILTSLLILFLSGFTTGNKIVDQEIQRVKNMGYDIPTPAAIGFVKKPYYNRTTDKIGFPNTEREEWSDKLWRDKSSGNYYNSAIHPSDGYIPSQTRHELAHLFEARNHIFVDGKWFDILRRIDIKNDISEYAATNEWEAFAEAFAMYTSPLYATKIKRLPRIVEEYLESLKSINTYHEH